MNRPLVLLLAAALPLAAPAAPHADLDDIARLAGLSGQDVRMVVGAPTAYAGYLTRYDWARHRLQRTLGAQRLQDLVAGRPVRLDDGRTVALAQR